MSSLPPAAGPSLLAAMLALTSPSASYPLPDDRPTTRNARPCYRKSGPPRHIYLQAGLSGFELLPYAMPEQRKSASPFLARPPQNHKAPVSHCTIIPLSNSAKPKILTRIVERRPTPLDYGIEVGWALDCVPFCFVSNVTPVEVAITILLSSSNYVTACLKPEPETRVLKRTVAITLNTIYGM